MLTSLCSHFLEIGHQAVNHADLLFASSKNGMPPLGERAVKLAVASIEGAQKWKSAYLEIKAAEGASHSDSVRRPKSSPAIRAIKVSVASMGNENPTVLAMRALIESRKAK